MRYIEKINEPTVTYGQMNLLFSGRTIWREIATWTWIYLISRFTTLNNISEEVFSRLYQTPQVLGGIFQFIFGFESAQNYLQLLSVQLALLKEIIDSEIAGNAALTDQRVRQLYQNADERARFVSSINPFWNETQIRNLLYTYNRYTLEEITSFLTGNYSESFSILDLLLHHADNTGDYFTQGLFAFLTNNQQFQPFAPNTGSKQA